MSDPGPDRIELGSTKVPDVLRTLAGLLPQAQGDDLEGQLQTFDVFLGVLSPLVRPEIAGLLTAAAAQHPSESAHARLVAAAESIVGGGRATAPYNHTVAMESYRTTFQANNPPPAEQSSDEPEDEAVEEESVSISDDGPFRESIKRRAIVMEIGGFRPPSDPKTSWFGKVAFGLPDEAWPVAHDGHPLAPLAQVNVGEFPFRPPHLEKIAFLTVFIDTREFDEDEANGSSWCVRSYGSLDRLVPLELPAGARFSIKAFPMRPKVVAEDYPVYDDVADDIPEELTDSYQDDFENVPGFKFGGWPTLVQSSIYWSSPTADSEEPEFVFQIDRTEKGHWGFGDGGVGYFGIAKLPGGQREWRFASQSL